MALPFILGPKTFGQVPPFGITATIFLSISKKKFPFPCDVEVGDEEDGQ